VPEGPRPRRRRPGAGDVRQHRRLRRLAGGDQRLLGAHEEGEKDAVLAQKLGPLQPFIAVFPQERMGQLASFGPTSHLFLAEGLRRRGRHRRAQRGRRVRAPGRHPGEGPRDLRTPRLGAVTLEDGRDICIYRHAMDGRWTCDRWS
jgi:hypothetical protein